MSYSNPVLCGLLAKNPTELSLKMHNAGFRVLNLKYQYVAFDTEDTKGALAAMKVLGIKGLSVTIPHKEKVLRYLDKLDASAEKIGAVNTIVNRENKLYGYNTDWVGITKSLEQSLVKLRRDKISRTLILGAGGSSRAAIYALQKMQVPEICIFNRNSARAKKLATDFGNKKTKITVLKDSIDVGLENFDLIINSTPLGSKLLPAKISDYPFELKGILQNQIVFDFVTQETPLTKIARKNRAEVIPGKMMLIFQALEQFKLFTGKSCSEEVFAEAIMS